MSQQRCYGVVDTLQQRVCAKNLRFARIWKAKKSLIYFLLQVTTRKCVCTSSCWTCCGRATWRTASGGWTGSKGSSSSPPSTRTRWRTTGASRRATARPWRTRRWPAHWGIMGKQGRFRRSRKSWPISSVERCYRERLSEEGPEDHRDICFKLNFIYTLDCVYLWSQPIWIFTLEGVKMKCQKRINTSIKKQHQLTKFGTIHENEMD